MMKNIRILILTALVLFFDLSVSWSATYYVSNTASNGYQIGNNANTTTQALSKSTPWLTMMGANAKATAGDTIVVNSGIYPEDDGAYHSFIPTKNLTFVADGSVTIRSFSSTTAVLRLNSVLTLVFQGPFVFDGEGTRSYIYYAPSAGNVTFTGPMTFSGSTNAMFSGSTSTLSFTDPTITNSAGSIFGGSASIDILRPTISMSGTATYIAGMPVGAHFSATGPGTVEIDAGQYAFSFNTGDNVISDLSLNINTDIAYIAANTGAGVRSNTWTNNTITFAEGVDLTNGGLISSVGSNTFDISGNTITHHGLTNATPIISISVANGATGSGTISSNTITTDMVVSGGLYTDAINVSSAGGTGNFNVQNNTIHTQSGGGHAILIGSEGSTAGDNKITGSVTGNYVYGANRNSIVSQSNVLHGLMVGYNTGIEVARNHIEGSGFGMILKGVATASGVKTNAHRNVTVNCKWGIYNKGLAESNIYNNTLFNAWEYDATTVHPYGIRVDKNSGTATENVIIKNNNIVYLDSTGGPVGIFLPDADLPSGFADDYNNIYIPSGIYASHNSTAYDLASWRVAGHETHGLSVDPLFVDSDAGNFRLQPSSPLINAGVRP